MVDLANRYRPAALFLPPLRFRDEGKLEVVPVNANVAPRQSRLGAKAWLETRELAQAAIFTLEQGSRTCKQEAGKSAGR